jgi:hypothetical protein
MIRRIFTAGFALALLFVFAPAAEAQLNLRGLRFPASLQNVFLLRGEPVQNELKLDDEQKKQLQELSLQLQQEAFEIMSGLQDLTPEEQQEQMPEVMKMIEEKGKEIQDKVDEILKDEQKSRLKELSLQARGAAGLEDEEVAAALELTDEHKKKLAEIREEGNAAIQEALQNMRAGGGAQGEIREKMGKLREELGEKAMAVLTEAQREKLDKMKGAKFEFPRQRGGGGLPF